MSFLGGRPKQRVVSRSAGNSPWCQDATKFGQKMLERMGWKSGQGLGKNNNGMTGVIPPSYKNDLQGLGFREFTTSSVQQDNFTLLLQSLNKSLEGESINTTVNNVQLNSLEKKSEQSRVRVHYRKATRGKDISQYSEKDLANIFCMKDLKDGNEKMQERIAAEINGGNMAYYFKQKLASKKQSKHSANDNSTNLESFRNEITTNKSENIDVLKPSFVSYLDASANEDIKKKRKFKECSNDSVSCGKEVKSEETNQTVDCDIMLNVTNQPVKTNANKDFFNDVHSKIQKIGRRKRNRVSEPEEHIVLGDLESQIDEHERHEEGVKLSFKKSNMTIKTLSYHRSGSLAKTSYKQFIKGDLLLHFKNSNLHEVEGYGKKGK